jgi:lantibiotic modifying enzyme
VIAGYAGLGVTLYRASQCGLDRLANHSKMRSIEHECASAIDQAFYIARQRTSFSDGRVTFLEGYSGVLALRYLICTKESALDVLLKISARDAGKLSSPEMLYGYAGLLFSLIAVYRHMSDSHAKKMRLREAISTLIASMLDTAVRIGDVLHFSWHNKRYLGAAHGTTGIIHALLLAGAEFYHAHSAQIVATLKYLCSEANDALPSRHGSSTLYQWCHGSGGLIMTLCNAELHAQNLAVEKGFFLAEAERLAPSVWKHGLLVKGTSLCHGVSGNAYAFLALYRASSNPKYLRMAQHFALVASSHFILQQTHTLGDDPLSLYCGVLGAAVLLLDLQKPLASAMPGFEFPLGFV